MKMNFVKKLAVRAYWVCSLAALLLMLIGWIFPQLASALHGNAGLLAVGIVFVVVFIVLAVCVGMMLFGKKPEEDERGFITVECLETGKVKVAIAAIDQMIRQAVRGVDGISEMKAEIENNTDSISIDTSVIVRSGMHIPSVTASMQSAIRGYIERNCGVAVQEVSVSVRLVDEGEANGKRGRKKAAAAQIEPAYEPAAEAEPVQEPAAEEPVAREDGLDAPLFADDDAAAMEDNLDDEIVLTLDPIEIEAEDMDELMEMASEGEADGEEAEGEDVFFEDDMPAEEETEIKE